MIKSIHKNNLPWLWEVLAERGLLYLPQQEGPVTLFKPWREGAVVTLDTISTAISPKEIFMPRDEVFLYFGREGSALEMQAAAGQEGPVTVFGLHACDLKALELLDMVFLGQDPPDALYSKRRAAATVVSVACRQSDPFCFCSAFGISPVEAPGADVAAWWEEEHLLMEPRTRKGEAAIHAVAGGLEERTSVNKPVSPVTAGFDPTLDKTPAWLKERFDHPAWDNLYRSCLGCGVCTFICPTCHCFDLQDYGCHEQGERFRCWDSCMFGEFTLMAGGHNPRPGRRERVRNRFLHKLQYFPEKHGVFGCVGCGRCLRSCPVNLDIVYVARALGGGK